MLSQSRFFMLREDYDVFDSTIAEWYDKVVGAGYHDQSEYVRELLEIIPRGGSVLELGCGTGQILKELNKYGRVCEGIDKSKDMIDKGLFEFSDIVTYPVDVRNFTPSRAYDYILSCNGVFSIKGNELESYLLERNEVLDCLRRYSNVSRKGILISKGTDKEGLRLGLNGEEFVHREMREKDIMVMIHLIFSGEELIVERTNVKRRYCLEEILDDFTISDFKRFILLQPKVEK